MGERGKEMICGNCRGGRGKPGVVLPTVSLIIPSLSKTIHRSEWRPTLDDAHPFKSNNPITPPTSPEAPLPLPPPPSRLQVMTALPSFVELMATLGLDNKSSPSPTQEFSSPAIVVSSEHEPTQEHISSRIRVARYSPYGAPIVSLSTPTRSNRSSLQPAPQSHSHRRSASTLSSDGTDSELPNRVYFRDPISFFFGP